MRRALGIALTLLALAACTSRDFPVDPAPQPDEPEQLLVAPPDELSPEDPPELPGPALPAMHARLHLTLDPAGATSVDEVRAVLVAVDLENAPGKVTLTLDLDGPGELAYERRQREIEVDSWRTAHEEFAIPVAGTIIQHAAMAGTWTVHFKVGDEAAVSQTFELR